MNSTIISKVNLIDLILGFNLEGYNLDGDYPKHPDVDGGNPFDTGYANNIILNINYFPGFETAFQDFKDTVVVDLGAGRQPTARKFAELGGAKGYIAVEPFYHRDIQKLLTRDKSGISSMVVVDDMLSFLKRIPSKSVSVWMSGIDDAILPNENYQQAVDEQLGRVIHNDGAYMSFSGLTPSNKSLALDKMISQTFGEVTKEDDSFNIMVYKNAVN